MLTVLYHGEISAASTLTVMALTRIERNQVYEAIAASALNPAECSLSESGGQATVKHNGSGSTFSFSPVKYVNADRRTAYRVNYKVHDGHSRIYETERQLEKLVPSVTQWADEVKMITSAPDLWADMRTRNGFLEDTHQNSGNTPFTQDEQRQIVAQLRAIKIEIAEKFEIVGGQLEQIEERLDEAAEASTRLGRKDWLIYFMGTITGLIITATVVGGVGEQIFSMVIQGIGHLFTGGDGPPRILA